MSDINLEIRVSEELYNHIKNDNVYYLEDGEELYAIVRNGVRHETVTEFADRCKECGRMQKEIRNTVKINGKTYSVKTLIYEYERLTKEVKAAAEHHRLVLNQLREEIESHCGLAMENHCRYCSRCTNLMGIREILETIDKYGGGRNEFR